MRVVTFVIALLIAILPDYVPAVTVYDATDVILEEVLDTEEESIVTSYARNLKRVPAPSRRVFPRHSVAKHEPPQLFICGSIERQWLVSCSLRL